MCVESTNLYSGSLKTNTVLNAQGSTPAWDIDIDLSGIDMGPFLRDMADSDAFTGRLNFNSDVSARGANNDAIMRSLNGNAKFNIDDGVLNGVDLAYWYSVGSNMLSSGDIVGSVVSSRSNTKKTEFIEASGSFVINNGVATNKDLKLYNDGFYATGSGDIDLGRQKINYSLRINDAKEVSPGVYEPTGTAIPVKITGDLADPSVGVDTLIIQELILQQIGGTVIDQIQQVIPIFGAGAAAGAGAEEATDDDEVNVLEDPGKAIGDRLKKLF